MLQTFLIAVVLASPAVTASNPAAASGKTVKTCFRVTSGPADIKGATLCRTQDKNGSKGRFDVVRGRKASLLLKFDRMDDEGAAGSAYETYYLAKAPKKQLVMRWCNACEPQKYVSFSFEPRGWLDVDIVRHKPKKR